MECWWRGGAGDELGAVSYAPTSPWWLKQSYFFQTMCQRVLEWSAKVGLLPHQPIAPTISNHFSRSHHFKETHREQAGSKPAHTVPAQLTGEHLAVVYCKPPAYREERVAGGLLPLAKWVSLIILPSPLMPIRNPASEDASRAVAGVHAWLNAAPF